MESLPNLMFLNGKSTKENKDEDEEGEYEGEEGEAMDQMPSDNPQFQETPKIPEAKNESDSNENTQKQSSLMDKINKQNLLNNPNAIPEENLINQNKPPLEMIRESTSEQIPVVSSNDQPLIQNTYEQQDFGEEIIDDENYENEMNKLNEMLNEEDAKGESLESEIPKFQVNIFILFLGNCSKDCCQL
ncbi:MAG: hypothetical protein MJ252_05650 [archaeon]|nr:hypothetical protein [archaeon]